MSASEEDDDGPAGVRIVVCPAGHVYPRLVEGRRMTPGLAATEIAIMEAIAADYREQAQQGSLI